MKLQKFLSHKHKGSGMMMAMLAVTVVFSFVSMGLLQMLSSAFAGEAAARVDSKARLIAESKIELLKAGGYAALANQAKTVYSTTDFQTEVIVGTEVDAGGGNKTKDVLVNVYKNGETDARFALPLTLSSQGSGSSVPVGTVIWYAASTAPDGFLECNGQSTSGYSELATIVGPNVPNLLGKFIRGWEHGSGVDPGRSFGSTQIDALQNIKGTIGDMSSVYSPGVIPTTGAFVDTPTPVTMAKFAPGGSGNSVTITFNAANSARTADETRPINIALLPCIKY